MTSKRKTKPQQSSSPALIAAAVAGGIGALIGMVLLGRRGAVGVFSAVDNALDEGSTAADLKTPRHPGPGDRAPTDFRPDPTAPVNPRKRDGMAPATLPNPVTAEPAI